MSLGSSRTLRTLILLLCLAVVDSLPASAARAELVSSLGYKDGMSSPFVLLGANLIEAGKQSSVGLHLSNVLTPNAAESMVTVGVEAELWHLQPMGYYACVKGAAFVWQQGATLGRTITVEGQGSIGSVKGSLVLGYVERHLATFPWENEDAVNGVVEDKPYHYVSAAMAANVNYEWGLKWSQDVTVRRYVDDPGYRLGISTGPELRLGPGSLTAQGGVIFGADRIQPMVQVRFVAHDPVEGKTELRISAANTSLGRDVPIYQGWYSIDEESWRLQMMLRLEHPIDGKPSPTVYFSIQPKF